MDIFEKLFENIGFTPNEDTKRMFKEVGYSLAASLISAGAFLGIVEIVKNGILAPKTTCVHIDNSVPVELFAIKGKNGNPEAVFISSKKRSLNIAPAAALAVLGFAVRAALEQEEKSSSDTIKVNAD